MHGYVIYAKPLASLVMELLFWSSTFASRSLIVHLSLPATAEVKPYLLVVQGETTARYLRDELVIRFPYSHLFSSLFFLPIFATPFRNLIPSSAPFNNRSRTTD